MREREGRRGGRRREERGEFATKILLRCSSLFSYYFLHHTCLTLLIYGFYKHEVYRSEDEENKKNLAEGVKKIKVIFLPVLNLCSCI